MVREPANLRAPEERGAMSDFLERQCWPITAQMSVGQRVETLRRWFGAWAHVSVRADVRDPTSGRFFVMFRGNAPRPPG
jgi:hypothetical protein